MSHSDEMADLCEGIAAVLEEKGHTTKAMYNAAGNVCLLGAGRLAQDSTLVSKPWSYENASVDQNTAEALGFSEPQKVAEYNDGYILKTKTAIPIPPKWAFLREDEAMFAVENSYQVVEETKVYPPINQQQAIDLAMDRAKYWRNQ